MTSKIKVRGKRISQSQKDAIVDFMEINPDLRIGKFSRKFSKKVANSLWAKLTVKLNGVGPAKKDFKDWRKCWQHLRSAVKEKASKNEALSDTEKRIVQLIGTTAIEGHSDILESGVKNVSFK